MNADLPAPQPDVQRARVGGERDKLGRELRQLARGPVRTLLSPRWRWATLICVISTVVDAVHGWRRYVMFQSAGYDLGIFDQAVRHYAHFHAPMSSIKGPNYNLLGDHFHPIIALLAPLYWLWPDPRMLELALAVLLGASVFPIYAFAERRCGPRNAVAVAAGYALWWPLQGLVDFSFHEIAFAVPLVAWLLDALDQRKHRTVFVLCLLLLLVREDMGAVVLTVAVVLLLRRERGWAAMHAVVGVTAYFLVTSVIVPFFSLTGTWVYWQYPALGPDASSALVHVLTHPWSTTLQLFAARTKQTLLFHLFVPFGGLALASPYFLLALPLLAARLLNSRTNLWEVNYQYNAILAPILVIAMLDTVSKLAAGRASFRWMRVLPGALLCGSVIVGMSFNGPYPLQKLLTAQLWSISAHVRDQNMAVRAIPAGVCVEADDYLIPHLVRTNWVTTALGSEGHATWMALDMSRKDIVGSDRTMAMARASADARGFVEVLRAGSLVVLQLPGAPVDAICRDLE